MAISPYNALIIITEEMEMFSANTDTTKSDICEVGCLDKMPVCEYHKDLLRE